MEIWYPGLFQMAKNLFAGTTPEERAEISYKTQVLISKINKF
jgi:hypothetical protein